MELNNRIRALNKYAENEHATALAQLRFVDTFVLPHAADTTIRRRRDVPQSSAIFYRANDDYTTTTTAAHTKQHRVKRGWSTGIIRRVQQGYADLLHKLGLDQRDAMIEQLQNARDLVSLNTRAVKRYNNRLHSVQSLTEHETDRVVHITTRSDNSLTRLVNAINTTFTITESRIASIAHNLEILNNVQSMLHTRILPAIVDFRYSIRRIASTARAWVVGVQALLRGELTMHLVSYETMQNLYDYITQHVLTDSAYKGFLLYTNVAGTYRFSDILYMRSEYGIDVHVDIPLQYIGNILHTISYDKRSSIGAVRYAFGNGCAL